MISDTLTKFQSAILDWVSAPVVPRMDSENSYEYNLRTGLFVKMGRQAGHTTVAKQILGKIQDSIVIVPAFRLQEFKRGLTPMMAERVFPSDLLDSESASNRGAFFRLQNVKVCVLDDATHISQWHREQFRKAGWEKYIELN